MTAIRNSNVVCSRRWFLLSAGSLILSGLLALLLSLARMPFLSDLVKDPVFFRRCLVIHVNLSLGVWLHSFMISLFFLLPGNTHRRSGLAFICALVGVLLMIVSGFLTGAPILSNYIPVIDNPIFLSGISFFAFGVFSTLMDTRIIPLAGESLLPPASFPGIRAAGISFIAAIEIFGMSILTTPRSLPEESFYEILFWGGGHVLIFSIEAAKLAVLIALVSMITGSSPLRQNFAVILFAVLIAPPLAGMVVSFENPVSSFYNMFFISIMRWTVFPVSLVVLFFCANHLWPYIQSRGRSVFQDGRFAGVLASGSLTIIGFIFGALIRNPNTLIPAHYHAAIGAVTVSFMAISYELLPRFGFILSPRAKRYSGWQPFVFGAGQIVFASGFALAGAAGMGRKLYGGEQHVRGTLDYIGLGLVGLGGIVAVIGGLIFLGIVILAVFARVRSLNRASILSEISERKEDSVWKEAANIPSRS